MIARADFLAAVLSCVGTPVGHRGRTIGGALDCVGVPWAAAVVCGLELPETADYGLVPGGDQLAGGLMSYCDRVYEPARAHLWQVRAGRQARHVVVPVGYDEGGTPRVVHAWGKGQLVKLVPWPGEVDTYWRIRGIE
jgi:hypothetical protein